MLISSSRQMPPFDAMRNARQFAPRVKQTLIKCNVTAVARTAALIADPSVPLIFEAAFEHVGVRVGVDMLKCLADGNRGCARSRGAPASRVITTTIPPPRPASSEDLGFR